MIHNCFYINRVKHSHERFLRLICSDKIFSHEELLEKDGSVSIAEMFTIKNGMSAETFLGAFLPRMENHGNLR